jgi:hypothetical protein
MKRKSQQTPDWRTMSDAQRRVAAREQLADVQAMMNRLVPAHLRERLADEENESLSEIARCARQVSRILRPRAR